MSHPLDEALAEARRMLRNAQAMGTFVPLTFGGHPFPDPDRESRKAEQASVVEKWTRIEKALLEAIVRTPDWKP